MAIAFWTKFKPKEVSISAFKTHRKCRLQRVRAGGHDGQRAALLPRQRSGLFFKRQIGSLNSSINQSCSPSLLWTPIFLLRYPNPNVVPLFFNSLILKGSMWWVLFCLSLFRFLHLSKVFRCRFQPAAPPFPYGWCFWMEHRPAPSPGLVHCPHAVSHPS